MEEEKERGDGIFKDKAGLEVCEEREPAGTNQYITTGSALHSFFPLHWKLVINQLAPNHVF